MKTEKLIGSLFSSGSSGRTKAITALIGGLAIGAVVAVLFATDKGKAARQKISESFSSLFNPHEENEQYQEVSPMRHQAPPKRPKSDIKSLLHHAHGDAAHTEQHIG